MKNVIGYFKVIVPATLMVLLMSNATLPGQDSVHYLIEECGQPDPCVFTSASRAKMPVPCNCIPKTADLLNIKITVKSAKPEDTAVKIVTADGKVYASSETQFGGRIDFDAQAITTSVKLGAVNRSLFNNKLKAIITTFVPGTGGALTKKVFTVNVGE